MDRRILIPVFLLLAVIALGYAIYRSTAVRVTIIQNGQPTVYGEPQHGFLLGMCVFAGLCILAAAFLADRVRDREVITRDERPDLSRRTLS
jgi:hypothetical protein